jgi:hypothetical protein
MTLTPQDAEIRERAMAKAMAMMDARAAVVRAHRQRIDADPRLNVLREANSRLKHMEFAHGMLGGMQVFLDLISVDNAVGLRITALVEARTHQINGLHEAAVKSLARASMFRREALRRRARGTTHEAA